MFELTDRNRYYLCRYPVSMSNGIDGLCRIVNGHVPYPLLSGDCFVFLGKSRKMVKILRWDGDGFLLYQKRLAKGTFEIPPYCTQEGCYELSWETFFFIMRGVSLCQVKMRQRLNLPSRRTATR